MSLEVLYEEIEQYLGYVQHPVGTVYLLHFDTPYKHARHYVGWTSNLRGRMFYHRHNMGARLLQVLNEQHIPYYLARTWTGTRAFERKLKKNKMMPRLCPVCKAQNKGETKYWCKQCYHKHYLSSLAGKRHYHYGWTTD